MSHEDQRGWIAEIEDGPGRGRAIEVRDTSVLIGASEVADLRVIGPGISAFQVEIVPQGEGLFVRDVDGGGETRLLVGRGGPALLGQIHLGGSAKLKIGESQISLRRLDGNVEELASAGQKLARPTPGPEIVDEAMKLLVGSSAQMREVRNQVRQLAKTSVPVLLLGETGTGKERAARAIHALSERAQRPWVSFNCAQMIHDGVAESTLFGHERGAFTGASAQHAGLFREAHGGTLFLDEIGDLPLRLQPLLLRALQEGEVRPVGGSKIARVDVRILTATHQDLLRMVNQGMFREDLFFRLNMAIVRLPPLRDRLDDLTELIPALLSQLAEKKWLVARSDRSVDELARDAATRHLHGNLRGLERFLVDPDAPAPEGGWTSPREASPELERLWHLPLKEAETEFRRLYAQKALARYGGKVAETAERVGVSRDTLSQIIHDRSPRKKP
jgi:DNA-binding NtrC family response regulator